MHLLPGLLSSFALIFFIEKPEYTNAKDATKRPKTFVLPPPPDYVRYPVNDRAFLDPIDFSLGKKSCTHGYVQGIDHFILTGYINATGFTLPKVFAVIGVMYLLSFQYGIYSPIYNAYLDLWNKLCTDIQEVPLGQCRCKYESNNIIRVKWNITANIWHSNMPFVLNYITNGYSFGPHRNMTRVYRNTSCRVEYPNLEEFHPEHARLRPPISDRAFLDPIDYSSGKRSCSDGYVHGIDHFILTGYLNVTGYTLPKLFADFMIMYYHSFRVVWYPIGSTRFNLEEDRCTDIQQVPLNKCGCKYESATTIRVKCNISAAIEYSRKPFLMNFITDIIDYSAHRFMTKVYRNVKCDIDAAKSEGTRPHVGYNGRPDFIFLVTPLVYTVTSKFSHGH